MKQKIYAIYARVEGKYVPFDDIEYTHELAKKEIRHLRRVAPKAIFRLLPVGEKETEVLSVTHK